MIVTTRTVWLIRSAVVCLEMLTLSVIYGEKRQILALRRRDSQQEG